jgi:hypothetical protein
MIVGKALEKVFEGLTMVVDNVPISVQFDYGGQKQFIQWQLSKMKSKAQKYPLIWYVIVGHDRQENRTINIDGQLLLFSLSKEEYRHSDRTDRTYIKYLEPLVDLVEKTLSRHPHVQLLERPMNCFPDEPNFGKNNDDDFDSTSSRKKEPKSIGIDIVDAKILKLKININVNCILT